MCDVCDFIKFVSLNKNLCMAKTKDANFKVLSMTTRIHEDKTLIKHISCDFKCKFNSAPFNSNQ